MSRTMTAARAALTGEPHPTASKRQHPSRAWPWVRDFALVGAVTGVLAPLLAMRVEVWNEAARAGIAGAVAGAVLGGISSWLMSGRMRRWSRLWLFPLGVLLGALWGAASGAAAGFGDRHLFGIWVGVAGIAGALQLGWFWFAYCIRRVNLRRTWPVTLAASVIGSGLGFAASVIFIKILDL